MLLNLLKRMAKINDVQWEAAEWVASLLYDGYEIKAHYQGSNFEMIVLYHTNGNKAKIICHEDEAILYVNGKSKKVYQHRLA